MQYFEIRVGSLNSNETGVIIDEFRDLPTAHCPEIAGFLNPNRSGTELSRSSRSNSSFKNICSQFLGEVFGFRRQS